MPRRETQRTKAEQSGATRAALVATARRLFTEHGYAATATEDVVEQAGVTRGALYYHFRDKRSLFEAVDEEIEAEIARRVVEAAAAHADPWDQLTVGCLAYLDMATEPAVRQVVLIDGPSVLGWELWREIDARHAAGLLMATLEAAVQAGALEPQPLTELAHVLLGALNEACLTIANSADPAAARESVGAVVTNLLAGLRRPT